MRYILAGVAAVALAAGGAYAEPGKGNGNGKGKPEAAAMKQDRGGGKDRGPQAVEHRSDNRGNDRSQVKAVERRVENRGKSVERRVDRAVENRVERRDERAFVNRGRDDDRDNGDRGYDDRRDGDRRFVDRVDYRRDRELLLRDGSRGLINGCPPGLAKKHNGCMPPGQAKDRYERSLFGYSYRPSLFGLSNYGDGRYYYNDGYLLRLGNGGGISGYIPLLGGALAIGNPWPTSYNYYPVPDYYVDYYDLGGSGRYRYADNVIYRVDPEDAAIMSVAALLTGDDIRVGQPMPMGYDVYNVPYAYRDRYYDTPDAYYRYSDGYVYRVDPETQLVAAVIDLLV
ncbi:hypothetical protein [Qipengyuania sp. RANM35]|uniref:hypothetical protein n=1 Tax=Qipengyuania sp. RANM35 TaxID=3068635 RepID=UPI0034DB58D5